MHVTGEGRQKRNGCKILAVNFKGDHLDDIAVDYTAFYVNRMVGCGVDLFVSD
jgi:hypothetical protein